MIDKTIMLDYSVREWVGLLAYQPLVAFFEGIAVAEMPRPWLWFYRRIR